MTIIIELSYLKYNKLNAIKSFGYERNSKSGID